MIRMLTLLLMLSFLPLSGIAEAPLTFADDLTGIYTWPEGSSEADATYVYRYTYPQVAGDSGIALAINNVFQYEATDAIALECPMNASVHPAQEPQMQVTVSGSIEHLGAKYLSVRIDKQVVVGESVSNIVKAYTFQLTGSKAGSTTSLPYMLELIEVGSTDDWLIDRQTAKADDCARDLVWMLIEKDRRTPGSAIYEDLTFEEFEWSFYPEEDLYLNAEGDLVFFIQENTIAPAEAGQFFYTITLDEMLDEI